jgi:hypothetical protein
LEFQGAFYSFSRYRKFCLLKILFFPKPIFSLEKLRAGIAEVQGIEFRQPRLTAAE